MGSSPNKPQKNSQPSNPSKNLRNLKSNKAQPANDNNILNDDNRMLDSQSISSYHFDPHEDFVQNQNNRPLNIHQIGGDPEIKFRDFLLSKKKFDMHTYYFRSNQNLKQIKVPMVNSNLKKITPFRNKSCRSGNCVYDIEELVKKAYEINFDYDHEFNCYQCKHSVKLGSFSFDATLSKIADQVFKKYNKTKLQCKEITIFRNGIWEPTLPEYLKQLENREKDGNTTRREENKITDVNDMPILRPMKPLRKIADFSGYTPEEEKFFEKTLFQKKYPSEKTLFKLKFLQITMKDYENLKNETISSNMMCFFLEYLDEMPKGNHRVYNFDNGSLFFTMAINVLRYDKFSKKASYEFLKGRENDFNGNLSLMRKKFNKLAMVILMEGRWILIVVELVAFDYYVLDFLKSSLTDLSVENIADLAICIFSKEFDADLASFNLYDVEKIHFMSDCGVYVTYFLHKLISNPHLQYIGVESKEKNTFKRQLAWSVLKSSPIFSKPILFYQFKEKEKDLEDNRQEKRRHHSNKHRRKKKEFDDFSEDRILPQQLLKRHNATSNINDSNDQNSLSMGLPDREQNEEAKNEIMSRGSMKTNRTSMKASRGSTIPDRKSKLLKNPGDINGEDEILTMTKEEFQEILNNFKLKMLGEIKEKNEQEEEEFLKEDIQVEDDMIYMNKYHLKRLLQEYEEILRDKFEAQDEDSENSSGSSNDNGYYNPYYNNFWRQDDDYDDEIMDIDNDKLKNLLGIKEPESDSEDDKKRRKKKKRKKKNA